MQAVIKVVLADDHPLVRSGMRAVLHSTADIRVVAETPTTEGLSAVCTQYEADVLVLDVNMPGPGLVETLGVVQRDCPAVKVVVLSATADAATTRAATKMGVRAYMQKDDAAELLAVAVRTVARGATWYSEHVIEQLMHTTPSSASLDRLTEREIEILTEIAAGHSNNQIARRVRLGEQTVRNYTSTIYTKIQVSSRTEAVLWAIQHGLGTTGSTSD